MPISSPILTLMTYGQNVAGFSGGSLKINVRYGESLENALNNFNQYRSPANQIHSLYNVVGARLPQSAFRLQLKENTKLYIDTKQNPFSNEGQTNSTVNACGGGVCHI